VSMEALPAESGNMSQFLTVLRPWRKAAASSYISRRSAYQLGLAISPILPDLIPFAPEPVTPIKLSTLQIRTV
jgi:hypothetical protein